MLAQVQRVMLSVGSEFVVSSHIWVALLCMCRDCVEVQRSWRQCLLTLGMLRLDTLPTGGWIFGVEEQKAAAPYMQYSSLETWLKSLGRHGGTHQNDKERREVQ